MTAGDLGFPRFRAVAEHAVLVEFAEAASDEAYTRVIQLDGVLAATGFAAFIESVPAFVSLLVEFDPIVTDHRFVEQALRSMLNTAALSRAMPATREVLVCYDPELSPDLAEVEDATGLSVEGVVSAHLAGDYRVFMYGFAPGYVA